MKLLLLFCIAATAAAQTGSRYTTVSIQMRDGKSLSADVYKNEGSAAKPVILVQTPYNKNLYRIPLSLPPRAGSKSVPYDSAKYNYVFVDWRGFYESKDAAVNGYDRGLDGYDCVEWIAAQPWCDGKVGTWGPSALGAIQFLTARHHPPHLVCCVPLVKDFKTKYTDYYYGGVYRKEQVETLEKLGFLTTSIVLSQPVYNAVWRVIESNADFPDEFAVPMLLISGWFDHYPDDVLRAFDDIRAKSDPAVRGAHRLIFGPWLHSGVDDESQGELTYPGAGNTATPEALRFFDHHLRGEQNGWPPAWVMQYYQMGSNAWRTSASWPPPGTAPLSLYLRDGHALSLAAPDDVSAFSEFAYDPRDPSPAFGAARFNPFDPGVQSGPLDIRQAVESRNDCAIFTTDPLPSDLETAGPVAVNLFLSSDRTDTDVSVRLCDVYPDGRSMILTDGIKRLRFREGLDHEVPMTPGQVYPVTVELQNLAQTFLAGHRLRIVIASADYPRFDINLNNGGPMYTAGDTLVASNRIWHDMGHPSSIVLRSAAATPAHEAAFLPDGVELLTLHPNPASGNVLFTFLLPETLTVALEIVDMLGRRIATAACGRYPQGISGAAFDTTPMPSGMYLARLTAGSSVHTRLFAIH